MFVFFFINFYFISSISRLCFYFFEPQSDLSCRFFSSVEIADFCRHQSAAAVTQSANVVAPIGVKLRWTSTPSAPFQYGGLMKAWCISFCCTTALSGNAVISWLRLGVSATSIQIWNRFVREKNSETDQILQWKVLLTSSHIQNGTHCHILTT